MSELDRARTYLEMNRPEQAITYARKAVASDPDSGWTRSVLLEALIQSRRTAEALKEGRAALAVAPDDAAIHKLTGVAAYQEGRYKEVREHLQRSLELWPGDPGTHGVLAKTFAHLRKKSEALDHAARAVSLAPEDPFAHRAKGDVHVEFRDWENAKASYRRSLELDPQDTYTHTNLGYVLQESGDKENALEHTITAARLDRTNRVATGNVVGIGRAAIGGSGLAIYLVFRFGASAWRNESLRVASLVGLVAVIAGLLVYRKAKEGELPAVVQEALKTQRRLEGPLPTPVWVLSTVAGSAIVGGVLARFVDDDSNGTTRDSALLALGLVTVVTSAYFIRRRMRQRDLTAAVGWGFPVWAVLSAAATLVSAWLFVQILLPAPMLDSRGDAIEGFFPAVSVAVVAVYIAVGKRPGRPARE